MTDLTWPPAFKPNLTPEQCIRAGIFGGTYFSRSDLITVDEFPAEWFVGLNPLQYASEVNHDLINRYRVHAGTSQAEWESQGWMHPDDPRGWFQWYCRYWLGRRHEDDERQIGRWLRFASVESGRWTRTLYGKVLKAGVPIEEEWVSPVIRQSLLHWAYAPNAEDYQRWLELRGASS